MKWVTLLFGLFLVLIIVLADMGRLGALSILHRIPSADKVGHFILYGIFALLLNLTLFRAFPKAKTTIVAAVSGLVLATLIGLEELSQQNLANRTFSLADLGASYLGVIVFAWLAIRTKSTGTEHGVNVRRR